jgi:uncharacterized protein
MKAVAALALALAPLGYASAQTSTAEVRITGTKLDIIASGEAHRMPDLATISAGVVTQAGNAGKAMADNASRMTATIEALKKAGVAARDIQTRSIQLSPQYRYTDGQPPVLTGYQASNNVSLRLRDLARAGSVLDALVAAGANQINGPDLSVDQPEGALDEARTAALATARARAELYAKAAGLRVARIVAISETGGGEAPVRPMPMMAMAKRDATPIQAGEDVLSVTLQVTFELQ